MYVIYLFKTFSIMSYGEHIPYWVDLKKKTVSSLQNVYDIWLDRKFKPVYCHMNFDTIHRMAFM